jgi:hypothetical protein
MPSVWDTPEERIWTEVEKKEAFDNGYNDPEEYLQANGGVWKRKEEDEKDKKKKPLIIVENWQGESLSDEQSQEVVWMEEWHDIDPFARKWEKAELYVKFKKEEKKKEERLSLKEKREEEKLSVLEIKEKQIQLAREKEEARQKEAAARLDLELLKLENTTIRNKLEEDVATLKKEILYLKQQIKEIKEFLTSQRKDDELGGEYSNISSLSSSRIGGPLSPAERMRLYRERQKMRGVGVREEDLI